MNTSEARKLWAEALESGEYEQTTEWLQGDGGFCCLGVACEVAEECGIRVTREWDTDELDGSDLSDQPDVQEWLGLTGESGSFKIPPYRTSNPNRISTSLVKLNDEGNTTFAELAAIIRAEPKGLFNE